MKLFTLDKFNSIFIKHLKCAIRLSIMLFSVSSIHAIFCNKVATFLVSALYISVIIDELHESEQMRYFVEKTCELSSLSVLLKKILYIKQIFPTITAIMFLLIIIILFFINLLNIYASQF